MARPVDDAPHVASAVQYCRDVVSGEQPACKWARLACQRQLDERRDHPDTWRFDERKAERICNFIEGLPHIKGRWARKRETIRLEPWQCFILTTVFGWYLRDPETDRWRRRFRVIYLEVARKNAKTTIASGVGLYCGFAEGEAGAEVYSAATGRDQARICFDIARDMTRSAAGAHLCQAWGIEPQAHNIYSLETLSKFEPLAADAKGLDGKNPHVAIVDEFHAHKSPAVRDALRTGMGAREQPLEWIVTTAGSNLAGPCYSEQAYAKKVLEGVVRDDAYFAVIYSIDQGEGIDGEGGDDWTDPAAWAKANPNLGVSVFESEIAQLCEQARHDPIKQAAFLTKRLNVWVSSDTRAVNMQEWQRCGEPFDPADFAGEPCYLGVDLASRDDVAAVMMVWERDGHIYTRGRYYLPRDVVREKSDSTHHHYAAWAASGLFTLTPGNIIDYGQIEQDILEMPERGFQVAEAAFDPWQATQLMVRLAEQGLPCVEVRPSVQNFSEPFKELLALVKAGRFHHGGDPILAWMASNVVAHRDRKDNIFPNKERPEDKIDGVIGVLMALNRIVRHRGGEAHQGSDFAVRVR